MVTRAKADPDQGAFRMTADVAYSFRSVRDELERAVADYLAISRGSHLYADDEAHQAAESKAWERMMVLRDRADAEPEPAGAATA